MSRRYATTLGLLVLLALVLRAGHALGRESLFCDEAIQFQIVRNSGGIEGLVANLAQDAHPPLQYLFELGAYAAGLTTPGALRVLPVAFGTLSVLLLAWILRPRLGERTALLAAGLIAVSPYFIYFSGQLRNYSLFTLLAILHFGAALRFLEQRRMRDAALWGATAGLLLLSHYYGIFHIATAGIYLLVTTRSISRIVLAGTACTLVFAPWLPIFVRQLGVNSVPWFEPHTEPAYALIFLRVALGAGVAGWTIWFASCIRGAVATTSDTFRLSIVISAGGCLLAWILQHRFGAYQYRYVGAFGVLAIIPVAFALSRLFDGESSRVMGRTISSRARARLGAAGLLVVLLSQQMDARFWFRIPSPGTQVARMIETHGRRGDLVCVFDPFIRVVWEYHDKSDLPRLTPCHPDPGPFPRTPDLSSAGFDPDEVEEAVVALRTHLRNGGRIWFLGNGWYPSEEWWASEARPSSPTDAPLQRRFRAIHGRLLRTCYEEAEPVYGWDAPGREYWYPWTVLLFDPRAPELER